MHFIHIRLKFDFVKLFGIQLNVIHIIYYGFNTKCLQFEAIHAALVQIK